MPTDFAEIGGAACSTSSLVESPRQTEFPQANTALKSETGAPAEIHIPEAGHQSTPNVGAPPDTSLGGHDKTETHCVGAAQPNPDDGQNTGDTHTGRAIVGSLAMETRRYVDLCRAKQRLLLQAMAMARYSCDGDKVAGAKLYTVVKSDPMHPLHIWLMPYWAAMKPLEAAGLEQEKSIRKLARRLPVWEWAQSINGLSDRFLGLIVGECRYPVGEFRNPSCVWKRMGMAVIDGERQRRVTGDAAIEHGYVARRRALMWNIGESIIKQQVRKTEEGERFAIGNYGKIYLDRKAYEATKTDRPIVAHNRAKRYMEKRLLRELWKAWRAANPL